MFGWLRNDSARHPEDVRTEFFKGIGIARGLLQEAVYHFDKILDGFHLGVKDDGYAHSATTGKEAQVWTSAILPPRGVEFGAILLASFWNLR